MLKRVEGVEIDIWQMDDSPCNACLCMVCEYAGKEEDVPCPYKNWHCEDCNYDNEYIKSCDRFKEKAND